MFFTCISVTNASIERLQKIASPNTRGWCTEESLFIVHWDVENLSPSTNLSIFMWEGKVSCNFVAHVLNSDIFKATLRIR